MEWTTPASLAVRLGKQGYENRHIIQKYWTRLKAYLDMGATQIVVTGHAGAGKTVLAHQMHGRAREAAYELPTESVKVEVDALTAGSWAKLVRVLPGQEGYRAKGVFESLQNNNRLEGVIHLVDFGFMIPRDKVFINTLINIDGINTIESLRERNLKLEVENLRIVLSDIKRAWQTSKRPKWIVIAVNKVDLFKKNREAALMHYHPNGNGEFSKILNDFQKDIGAQNIPVYVIQSCAYEQDFKWNKKIIKSTLNRQEQNSILNDFTKSIAFICETPFL